MNKRAISFHLRITKDIETLVEVRVSAALELDPVGFFAN